MKKLIYILLFYTTFGFSQNQVAIDSLKNALKTATKDTVIVDTMRELYRTYIFKNKDSAMVYQNKMLLFSQKRKFDYGLYHANFYKSYYYYLLGNLKSELTYIQKAEKLADKMQNPRLQIDAYLRVGAAYQKLTKQDSNVYYIKKSLVLAKDNNMQDQVGLCNYTLAGIYMVEKQHDKALKSYHLTDSIFSKINPKHRIIPMVNENIAIIYSDLQDFENASYYNLKAEKLYKDINDERGLYSVKYKLGIVDLEQKKLKPAEKRLQIVYNYYKSINDSYNLAQTANSLAIVMQQTQRNKKSLDLFKESLFLRQQIKDSIGITGSLMQLGDYYYENNKFDKSLPLLKQALIVAKKLKHIEVETKATLLLSKLYKQKQNWPLAYNYLSEHLILKDSLSELNNINNLQKIETQYQTKEKEQEIVLLKSQNKLSEQQKTNQRNLLLGGLGLSTLLGLFFFIQYKNRQKTTKKLKELDLTKSNFFANISHEFRTPLTLILSPIDEELEKENLSKSQRNKFQLIKRNSNRLLDLVDQLLMLSKMEAKTFNLQVQYININELIIALSSSFEYCFKQQNIGFSIKTTENNFGYVDIDFIKKIVSNLLSNTLKYTKKQGKVIVNASIQNEKLLFQVSNSATNFSEEQLKNIFKKYYQLDSTNEGYGIGLTLVKELTEAHKGSILVENKDEMIAFKVILPIKKSAYSKNEIHKNTETITIQKEDIKNTLTPFNGNLEEISSIIDKPILLIVEDNLDMRTFIKNLFVTDYNIIVAENGEIGIEQALQYIPDIIISDVMMPKIDGIQLVKTLKRDQKTSHIPILLLSAKVEEEAQIKGIITGADDYILKPFSPKLIKAKIETILKNRHKTKEYYSQLIELKPATFSVNSTEELFFNKLQTVIDTNLQNPSFNVVSFSKEIGMSRMQLHRKLKATLGISASEFLRTERLKTARHLLQTSDLTISEVAYMSGFNDVGYFSKSFKKLFKIAPSDFKSNSDI
jgi:signal transduction histidine kinase/DNA-binding response OmpR family regulator